MTSTSLPNIDNTDESPVFITSRGIAWTCIIAALFITLFWDFIFRMGRIATGSFNGDWSHIVAIPLFSAYFVYLSRYKIAAAKRQTWWPGLLLLYFGIAGYAAGIYPIRNDMAQGYSMILCLFGLVLFTLGPSMTKVLWFPIAYLFFGVKVSQAIWDRIAWALQNIAAKSSVFLLDFMGYHVEGRGTTIDLTFTRAGVTVTEAVNVEEACSGLRMLMAFVALGVAIAFISDRKWWQRGIMLLATVPVAVAINVGRVTTISILHMIDKDYAVGDFHIFVGMLMLIPAGLIFLLLGWILDKIVIEDDDENKETRKKRNQDYDVVSIGTDNRSILVICVIVGVFLTAASKLITGRFNSIFAYSVIGTILAFNPQAIRNGYGEKVSSFVTGKAFGVGALLTLGISGLIASILYVIKPQMFSQTSDRTMPVILFMLAVIVFLTAIFGVRKTVVNCRQNPAISMPVTIAVTLGIMFVSVFGLKGVVSATELVLHKKPVPLRYEFYKISDDAGDYEKVMDMPPLNAETLQAVGTEKYLQRVYRNTKLVEGTPGSIVRLHAFYYTGTADTVPHVPDRCYIAGGMKPAEDGTELFDIKVRGVRYRQKDQQWWADTRLNLKGVRIPTIDIPATIFTYRTDPPKGQKAKVGNVVYFFAASGKFLPTPNHVRFQAFDPTDQYSYYCKIEVLPEFVSDAEQAKEIVNDFLSTMLPDIMACLPDWVDVRAGRWPVENEKAK